MIGSDFLKCIMGKGVFQEVRQNRKRPCVEGESAKFKEPKGG